MVVAKELSEFRQAARVLSSRHPRMIDKYQKQWVGIYQGQVAATGRTLQALLAQADKKEIPRKDLLVRFIDKNQRTLVL